MSKDRSPRRRPKAKQQIDQKPIWAYWRLFLVVGSLPAVAFFTYAVMRSPWLTVQEVSVRGTQTLDDTALKEMSGLYGQSMLRLDTEQAQENIIAIPQVKSIAFERNWPSGVTLKVRERMPVAYWSVGGRDYSVDDEGYVLATGSPAGPAPRIVEPGQGRVLNPGDRVHPDAIAFARRIYDESPRILGQSVRELEYKQDVGVTAVFNNNLRVTFGDERAYDYKVEVLTKLLDTLSAKKIIPRAVDLRFGERVTYE